MKNFKLDMQTIYDTLKERFSRVSLLHPERAGNLEGFRLFQPGQNLRKGYVYLLEAREFPAIPKDTQDISFIIKGNVDAALLQRRCPLILAEGPIPFPALATAVQELFELYQAWQYGLERALHDINPLDALLEASLPIFQNPIFIHDPSFYILSCPHRAPGMLEWIRDPRTGWEMAPLSLVSEFKANPDYLNTLTTTKAELYTEGNRGYAVLYINLWMDSRYLGRICVDELEEPIRQRHYLAIQYLADYLLEALGNKELVRFNFNSRIEAIFRDCLDGHAQDSSKAGRLLAYLNWKREDSYLCLRLETEQRDIRMLSAAAILGHIETQIPASYAFTYQDGITAIVNLSRSRGPVPEILSSLSVLLREGLLKMGASSEFHDFLLLPQAHYQAKTALTLGTSGSSMNWCHRFDDYLLEFLLRQGGEALSPEMLCSNHVLALKQYDERNGTELCRTLKIYLELERNILQTAKALFIHRSTLFYRLERIKKLTSVNLDDAKERLVLRLSYYIMEQKSPRS